MGLDVKQGSFAARTGSTGTQSHTIGFQAKIIFFYCDGQTSTGSSNYALLGFGVAYGTGANEEGMVACTSDTTVRANEPLRSSVDNCISLRTITGATTVEAHLDSWDATSFTLNYTTVGSARRFYYLALGGSDLSVFLDQINSPTSVSSSEAYTGVGFQPKCILPFSGASASTDELSCRMSIGAGTGASARWVSAISTKDDANPTVVCSRQIETEVINNVFDDADLLVADLVSLDSDGYTLDWSTVAGTSRRVTVVCLGGSAQFAVGTETAKITTTGTKATTGVGFQPSAMLAVSQCAAASASIQSTYRYTIGAATSSTERGTVWVGNEDGQTSADASRRNVTTHMLTQYTENQTTPTADAEADLDSFDSDGFTLDWTTVDSTAREFGYLAIGVAAAGGAKGPLGHPLHGAFAGPVGP